MLKNIYKKYEAVILYIIFGVLTTVVSFLTQAFASYVLKTPVMVSTVISWIAAVTFAYVTNRIFVFKSQERGAANIFMEVLRFFGARVTTLLMELLIMYLCADLFSQFFVELMGLDKLDYENGLFKAAKDPYKFNELIFKLFAQVLILISNYVLSKLLVFKKKS